MHTKYQRYKINTKNDRLILFTYTQRNKEMTTPMIVEHQQAFFLKKKGTVQLFFFLMVHWHLKGHLINLGLVNSPECDRCKQASETASHVPCDCEALATSRFRYLGHYFMKPGDFEDISVSKILHFAQGMGLLNE
jgi:hypothetical protein